MPDLFKLLQKSAKVKLLLFVMTISFLHPFLMAHASSLTCSSLFIDAEAYIQKTGGFENAWSNKDAVHFIDRFGEQSGILIRIPKAFNFGTEYVAGKLFILEKEPILLGIEEKHGDKIYIHTVDLSYLARAEITLFINRPDIYQRLVGSIELKAMTPLKLAAAPQATVSVNAQRISSLVASLQNRKNLFAADILADFFKGQPKVVRKLIQRWYEDLAPSVLKVADGMKEEHRTLLLDPGIASRAQHFDGFYHDYISNHETTSVLEIRQAFSKTLGMWKGWRGVMLPERITDRNNSLFAERLRLAGIFRKYNVRDSNPDISISKYFDEGLVGRAGMEGPTGVFDAMSVHTSNTMRTPFVSVTTHIEVAQSVAWDLMHRKFAAGQFHLVELQIPQIDLIFMSESFGGFTSWYRQSHLRTSKKGGEVFDIPMTAPGFEIFATEIIPEHVVNIYPYDNLPPGFEIYPAHP
jgi:hypothetical protein